MDNPFHFGSPVTGDQFTGRRAELSLLVGLMRDHVNAVVMSPRRFGKTSLVTEACSRIRAGGGSVVSVNAMRNADVRAFGGALISAVYSSKGPWHKAKESVGDFMARLRLQPSVTFGTSGPEFSLSGLATRPDPLKAIATAYELMAQTPTPVVFVDEFQELVSYKGDDLPRLFKGLADDHPAVALVIAGSKPHMMRDLTLDSRGPLFGMMQSITLGAIPADQMGDFVQRRFNIGGKPIDRDLADRIVALAGPVPNDIQQLAYHAFSAARPRQAVGEGDLADGLRVAVDASVSAFVDTYATLTTGQRKVLAALATRPGLSPQSAQFVALTDYANPSSVKRALTSLENLAVIAIRDGKWVVVNPFLRRWLAGE